MAIRHYGLDAAEIEHLKAAHLTDEEINNLNSQRVKEQMELDEAENDSDDSEEYTNPLTKKLIAAFPNAHPAVIGYMLYVETVMPSASGEPKVAVYKDSINRNGGLDNLNKTMNEIWSHLMNDEFIRIWTDLDNPENYDFEGISNDALTKEMERLVDKCTKEDDDKSEKLNDLYWAKKFAASILHDTVAPYLPPKL